MADPARPVPAPNGWRLLAGFLLAPIIPALPVGIGPGGDLGSLVLVLLVGVLPIVALVGVPAYFLWLKWCRPSPLRYALVGGFVAVAPWLPVMLGEKGVWTVKDCETAIDGVLTTCGWNIYASALAFLLIIGGSTGLGFWLIVYWRDSRFSSKPQSGSVARM